jgi:small subunit ribosomal protein S6
LKQNYETVVIFDGTLPEDAVQKESAKIEEFIKSNAEFERVDVWGKKSLAYTIKKKRTGVYHLFIYKGDSEKNYAGKIDKLLKLNDGVLRHLTAVREIPKIMEKRKVRVAETAEQSVKGE